MLDVLAKTVVRARRPTASTVSDTNVRELARLDYEQTTQLVRALTEVRFKLLAFVPTIAGAAVAFLSDQPTAGALLAVGLLGLIATLGIFVYELRNSQLYDAAVHRAKVLERRLEIRSVRDEMLAAGVFGERPGRSMRLFGRAAVCHDRGLGLVYAAALAGWTYLVAWGALALADLPGARNMGGLLGVAAGVFVVYEVDRLDRRADKAGALPDRDTPSPPP
jgi:hypothetical protein